MSHHSPMDWSLQPIQVKNVEFPLCTLRTHVCKYNFTAAEVEADTRLSRLTKTVSANPKASKAEPQA